MRENEPGRAGIGSKSYQQETGTDREILQEIPE